MPRSVLSLICLLALALFSADLAWAQQATVIQASRHNTSQPLRDIVRDNPVAPVQGQPPFAIPNKFGKLGAPVASASRAEVLDPVRQNFAPSSPSAPNVVTSFEGVSDDDNSAVVGVRVVPPDTEGDVGPNHYVQWVNLAAEIFDKSGTSLLGPFAGNAFFAGLGGNCASSNDGDPIVLYDALADRWLVSQFQVSASPNSMCIAISTTPDPTGPYYQYEFSFGTTFPDYPKLGVWSDSYCMTTRDFPFASFYSGQSAVAFDRAAMLAGSAASMTVFAIPGGTAIDGWLPANLDGPAPPAGRGCLFGGFEAVSSTGFDIYELDANWGGSPSFSKIADITVSAYDDIICNASFGEPCIPQPSPGELLDMLNTFLMFPMQYRNFGTHETLLVNHSVDGGGAVTGIRWYEFRDTGSGFGTHQEGTYAPADGVHRWMGSIAMNGNGDIALGYSASSTSLFPSIYFTGQSAVNSGTGVMDRPETLITAGTGVQTGSANRWGDYSAMHVDPSDDNTFWYTQEYYQTTGGFDFNTRIAHIDLDVPPPTPTTMSVASVVAGRLNLSRGNKAGTAAVTIVDNLGNLVSAATVTGTFSGDVTGTDSQPTNASGVANLQSNTKKGRLKFTFCVTNVTHASLTWDGVSQCGTLDPEIAAAAQPDRPSLLTSTGVPTRFAIEQNYPNPFNPSTIIAYALPEASTVSLKVYDLTGHLIESLAEGYQEAGAYRVAFDASRLSAGVYLYVIEAGNFRATKRMTLLK